ncbi:hypothetical protein FOZ61_001086 [Perkinsus olseni]|uniref:Uncharacterized protein n=1 Tax=Perkinsus olseni TaxID=32597 RepID=A0A7J6KR66_PEROL|nr:hypothetical protein FOZ61_001086 [Perkinsus olseni]KAF4650422.1 hypothetical protein FOL46_000980 [Perkinsus olseni]
MATILTLLFSVLVATVSGIRVDYQYSFDNCRITFGFDPSSQISDVKIKTECLIPSGPRAGSPYSTTTFTFPIDGGDCFHYFLMTPKAENAFETYRALLEESCGLSLHEEAFHDYFQFSGFVVVNIDQSHQVARGERPPQCALGRQWIFISYISVEIKYEQSNYHAYINLEQLHSDGDEPDWSAGGCP